MALELLNLNDIKLKKINLTESHTAQAQQSKDNFSEIEKYINNIRLRVSKITTDIPTPSKDIVKSVVRNDMIKIVNLQTTHIDGTTKTQTNGITVTRSGNNFIIQTTDATSVLFHNLRVATTKEYATAYSITMDNQNQLTIYFKPFIKEDLELVLFG